MKETTIVAAWLAAKDLARRFWLGEVYLSKERAQRVERQYSVFGERANGIVQGYQSRILAAQSESRIQGAKLQHKVYLELAAKIARSVPYKEYLASGDWQKRRRTTLKAAGYACQSCGASNVQLDVHHLTYERIGAEHNSDLRVLCRDCHARVHAN